MSLSFKLNTVRSPINLAYSAIFSSCYPNGYLQKLEKPTESAIARYDIHERQLLRHMDTQVTYLPQNENLFVPDLSDQVSLHSEAASFFRREITRAEYTSISSVLNPHFSTGDILNRLNKESNYLVKYAGSLDVENNDSRYAVCWSGGMDSLSAALYAIQTKKAKELILIHVNYNGPYSPKESGRAYQTYQNLVQLVGELEKIKLESITYLELTIGSEPMDESLLPLGYIMPGRNGFIATSILDTFGALELSTMPFQGIYMTGHYRSVDGQYTGAVDKNYHFFGELSNLYYWDDVRSLHISSPFLSMSKEEMLNRSHTKSTVNHHEKAEELFFKCIDSTVSCYDPVHDRCGNCSSCYKRWQALKTIPAYKEVYNIPVEQAPRYQEFASRENKKGR